MAAFSHNKEGNILDGEELRNHLGILCNSTKQFNFLGVIDLQRYKLFS